MKQFENKVVLITGAAGGFGAAAAHSYARAGARLALSDINPDALSLVADELTSAGAVVLTDRVDVSKEDDMTAHIAGIKARFERLDIAVNNAGAAHDMIKLTDTGVELFDRMMAINARGVFIGMKHQIPLMLENGGGAIVNISSVAGLVGAGYFSAYAAAKHAVAGLTRSAADEFARKNIRVNAICPAFAATALLDVMAETIAKKHQTDRLETHKRIAARVPMRRVGEPDEIVRAILFASDPLNTFMTGQTLGIDGGLSAI